MKKNNSVSKSLLVCSVLLSLLLITTISTQIPTVPSSGTRVVQELPFKPDLHNASKPVPSAEVPQDWYSQVQQTIADKEYEISWQQEKKSYSSPNRAQNLRFNYYNNGFSVTPRDNEDWAVAMTLHSFGKGVMQPYQSGNLTVSENTAQSKSESIDILYKNTNEGMRQDFLVKERPAGSGMLTLKLNIESPLSFSVMDDRKGIAFSDAQARIHYNYAGLKVTDASGRELTAGMENVKDGLQIVVNDLEAMYPILIDPLSTTAAWSVGATQANAQFGNSVSTAGDVNADGYSDVIVGAPYYDNGHDDEGRAYAYLGGTNGLSATPIWTAEGNQLGALFGISVSTAGGVNGDGYADVIVGAPYHGDSGEGRAFVYLGSATGLESTASWTAESNQVAAHFGISVSTAGDVNGDGYSDVIVGAPDYDIDYGGGNSYQNAGRAYAYLGSAGGLATMANWTVGVNSASSAFGKSVATAGDVNGDGYADVIIGAPGFDKQTSDGTILNSGCTFAYLGNAAGLSTMASWTATGNNSQTSAAFGTSVSTAGDVNGDGYSDVIVGAPYYDNGTHDDAGRVYFYMGSSTGLNSTTLIWGNGEEAEFYFGASVSAAGDVNGDGYADVIVGAPCSSSDSHDGYSYLYLGNGGIVGINLNAVWVGSGNYQNENFGVSVAAAGDVNGDGFSDVIVGANQYDYNNGNTNEGRALVYLGSDLSLGTTANWMVSDYQLEAHFGTSVSLAGDVDGDGYTDVIVGAPHYDNGQIDEGRVLFYKGSAAGLNTSHTWSLEGNQAFAYFGSSISTAGDVNGDGYSDVIVGAPGYDNGEVNEGSAFLYLGGNTIGSHTWSAESNQANASFGADVSTAGDVNGDGYSDVIVGADYYDNGHADEGRVYVYLGNATGVSASPVWTAESDQINAHLGASVFTAGDVNGDGHSDVIVGARHYDNGHTDEGRAYVYLGNVMGLSTSPVWTAESDQVNANFGASVSTAGDVNGDGYSDVIVGSDLYDNGHTDEGRAFLYMGSAVGLSLVAIWTSESNSASANFGRCVSTAGDVNGDGYSDVIIGAPNYYDDGLSPGKGKVSLYFGSAVGLGSQPAWTVAGTQANTPFGEDVSTTGDVNGDGYSDVIIGVPNYANGSSSQGRTFVYYGNNGGKKLLPRLLRNDQTTAIAPLGSSYASSVVGSVFAKSVAGRAKAKAQFEVKPLGTPFDGTGLVESDGGWIDTGVNGVTIQKTITGLSDGTRYKTRMRVRYNHHAIPYSRWAYPQGNGGLGETDFIVTKMGQVIVFDPLPVKTYGDAAFDVSATGGASGNPVTFQSSNTAVATVLGNTITIVGVGSTIITASQQGDAIYSTANVQRELIVNKANQVIIFDPLSGKTYGETAFDLSATGGASGNAVAFQSSNTSVATVLGSTVTIVGGGSTIITASQAGNSNFNAASDVQQELTVSKASQIITFEALPGKTFGDTPFELPLSASSGLSISYSSSDPAVATVEGNTVTITGTGTTTITASQAGNNNYTAASSVEQILTVIKGDQTIAFTELPEKIYGDAAFDLPPTASSSLAVSYSSSDPGVALIEGNVVIITGAGTTTITASQPGNSNYNAAPSVEQVLTVNKADQLINFNELPPKTFGNVPFDLQVPGGASGNPVTFESSDVSVATVSGNTVTLVSAGTTIITASQMGNNNYNAAPGVQQVLTVNKGRQTISFSALPLKTYEDAPFQVTATGGATGNPVTFESSNTLVATVSGNTITITGAGTTTITASQLGNHNYNAALNVERALTVNKANQTIVFNDLPAKTFGDTPFDLVATGGNSGNSVTFESSNTNVATVSGSTVTLIQAGPVTITASQAGSNNYEPAASVQQDFCVNPAKPAVTMSNTDDLILVSSASAGNQWYKDGVAINGATNATYEVRSSGTYTVIVTATGCSSVSSDDEVIIITTVEQQPLLAIYPNPIKDEVTIDTGTYSGCTEIEVEDVLGRSVYKVSGEGLIRIHTADWQSGVYLFKVIQGNRVQTQRVIKK